MPRDNGRLPSFRTASCLRCWESQDRGGVAPMSLASCRQEVSDTFVTRDRLQRSPTSPFVFRSPGIDSNYAWTRVIPASVTAQAGSSYPLTPWPPTIFYPQFYPYTRWDQSTRRHAEDGAPVDSPGSGSVPTPIVTSGIC